ncbi:protein NYNRIN-like [Penaeus japonicus]|uniref:protein NYNRIN-like n=1 Tax=Penaeus japonicus TaxID=27405 RepID=UPI001C710602|nr:protein NYNRIN-like [Penaeus japonicus]
MVKNYDKLKEALLRAYSVDADRYRRLFRESKCGEKESYIQMVVRMEHYLDRWISLSNVDKDYNSIFDFLVREQILNNCSADLRVFLKEHDCGNANELAEAAERYRSAHNFRRSSRFSQQSKFNVSKDNIELTCHGCGKTGHIRPNCPENPKNFKRISTTCGKVNFVFESELKPNTCIIDDNGCIFNKRAEVMLDSGCSTVVVKDSLVPANYKHGKLVKVYDYLGIPNYFPQIRCFIKSRFFTGWVNAIAAPIKFADILIGLFPGVKIPPDSKPADDPDSARPDPDPVRPDPGPSELSEDPNLSLPNFSSQLNKDLRSLLDRLRLHGLTAGVSKCFFGYNKINYLGVVLGKNVIEPPEERIKAIQSMPLPETKKELRSFIGTISYYRKFIPNFADISAPMNQLLKKNSSNKLNWNNDQVASFHELKSKIYDKPILCLPDHTKTFYLRCDASENGLGAVLLQEHNGTKMPIAYASRKLLDREKNFATIEKECLSIVWAVNKFKTYLYGKEFVLETDQQPLVYLKNMKNSNGKLMRWALALQGYSFRIHYIKGKENVGADILSRCIQ